MKTFEVVISTDNNYQVLKYRNKKEALEKYNEVIDRCYFPSDFVYIDCVERIAAYPDFKMEE